MLNNHNWKNGMLEKWKTHLSNFPFSIIPS